MSSAETCCPRCGDFSPEAGLCPRCEARPRALSRRERLEVYARAFAVTHLSFTSVFALVAAQEAWVEDGLAAALVALVKVLGGSVTVLLRGHLRFAGVCLLLELPAILLSSWRETEASNGAVALLLFASGCAWSVAGVASTLPRW